MVDELRSRKLLVPLFPFPEGDVFNLSPLLQDGLCAICLASGFGEGMRMILGSGSCAPKLKGKGGGLERFENSMALTWLYKRGRARNGKRGQF